MLFDPRGQRSLSIHEFSGGEWTTTYCQGQSQEMSTVCPQPTAALAKAISSLDGPLLFQTPVLSIPVLLSAHKSHRKPVLCTSIHTKMGWKLNSQSQRG